MHNAIVIKGVCEHNLKNIDVLAFRDQLTVALRAEGIGEILTLRTKSGH
jgi:excinuclease UvrABC ATPase subunit